MAPLFVAIEGLDGSGGTTQARLLATWLERQGTEVVLTREPSDGLVGRFIRKALEPASEHGRLGEGVLPYLFAADRRDHVDTVVVPALQRGAAVVSDRYYHSSLAYQAPVIGFAAVAALNDSFPAPDVTVLLDLDAETCLERVRARGGAPERFEALDRLREIQDAYESVVVHCRSRGENIVRIDASQPVARVHTDVVTAVRAALE
jgi:dTMP kinase